MNPSERTADQTKANNIAKMGEAIGSVYTALWQEVAWIHKKWAQYVALFGTSPERIALLNKAAPSMFRTVQDTLWEAVVLHIARLTDPPRSAGKENLSVFNLANLLKENSIKTEVESLANAVKDSCEFARDWRNRRLAHKDLALALGDAAQPLALASRDDVNSALSTLGAYLNAVSQHYLDSTTLFEFTQGGDDAVGLLYVLRDGLQFEAERVAKLKSGELHYSDVKQEAL
jgi:hypothetical protein